MNINVKIGLEIKDHKFNLSKEEALALYEQLRDLLGISLPLKTERIQNDQLFQPTITWNPSTPPNFPTSPPIVWCGAQKI